jgi:hypothetical protein
MTSYNNKTLFNKTFFKKTFFKKTLFKKTLFNKTFFNKTFFNKTLFKPFIKFSNPIKTETYFRANIRLLKDELLEPNILPLIGPFLTIYFSEPGARPLRRPLNAFKLRLLVEPSREGGGVRLCPGGNIPIGPGDAMPGPSP